MLVLHPPFPARFPQTSYLDYTSLTIIIRKVEMIKLTSQYLKRIWKGKCLASSLPTMWQTLHSWGQSGEPIDLCPHGTHGGPVNGHHSN